MPFQEPIPKSHSRKLCLITCFLDIWGALLNLVIRILCSNLPADKADLPPNILNTAVRLAVTEIKAWKHILKYENAGSIWKSAS